MTDSNMASSILNGPLAEGVEDEEEIPTIEEEFKKLHIQTSEVIIRYESVAKALLAQGTKPATKKDIANIYLALAGDILSLQRDDIAASGSAFEELFSEDEEGEEGEGDEGTEEEDGEVPVDEEEFEEQVQIYTAINSNSAVFSKLLEANADPDVRKSFEDILAMNKTAMGLIEERYGAEEVRQAMQEFYQKAASENRDGTNGS